MTQASHTGVEREEGVTGGVAGNWEVAQEVGKREFQELDLRFIVTELLILGIGSHHH